MNLVAVVGPTASGKTALGLALAETFQGEIISCDSTAVYRGIDIGTDKPSESERRGIAHHLIDVAGPTEVYSAARYASDASAAAAAVVRRGHLPIVVGGTGFYFRALTRGLFPGPGRDASIRERLERVAARKGVERLHLWLRRVDPESGRRIQPRDRKRIVRALEVYLLTGRPLTDHFEGTVSPLPDSRFLTLGIRVPRPVLLGRVARRVDQQFAHGVVAEVQALLRSGVPRSAQALGGLVYRQVVEQLDGVRTQPATRELIVRQNMRYAKRQLVWFKKEPGIHWLDGAGESAEVQRTAIALVGEFLAAAVSPEPRAPNLKPESLR